MKESGLEKIQKTDAFYRNLIESMKTAEFMTPSNFGSYAFEETLSYAKALFDVHPFKVGDIISLITPPDISNITHGWWSYRHLFVKGESFTVVDRDWSGKVGFTIGVKSDKNTYLDSITNKEEPCISPYPIFWTEASRFIDNDEAKDWRKVFAKYLQLEYDECTPDAAEYHLQKMIDYIKKLKTTNI